MNAATLGLRFELKDAGSTGPRARDTQVGASSDLRRVNREKEFAFSAGEKGR